MKDRLKPRDSNRIVYQSLKNFDEHVELSDPDASFARLMKEKAEIAGLGFLIRHVQTQFPREARRSRIVSYEAVAILFALLEVNDMLKLPKSPD